MTRHQFINAPTGPQAGCTWYFEQPGSPSSWFETVSHLWASGSSTMRSSCRRADPSLFVRRAASARTRFNRSMSWSRTCSSSPRSAIRAVGPASGSGAASAIPAFIASSG